MNGKVFALIALLALAMLIAGCSEKAGEAVKGFSNQPDQSASVINAVKADQDSLRADVEMLKTTVSQISIKYDNLKADYDKTKVENNALKADLTKFSNSANGKFELLKVKAGITGSDITKWDTYPIVTGYSWNNPVQSNPAGFSN